MLAVTVSIRCILKRWYSPTASPMESFATSPSKIGERSVGRTGTRERSSSDWIIDCGISTCT